MENRKWSSFLVFRLAQWDRSYYKDVFPNWFHAKQTKLLPTWIAIKDGFTFLRMRSEARFYLYHSTKVVKAGPGFDEIP